MTVIVLIEEGNSLCKATLMPGLILVCSEFVYLGGYVSASGMIHSRFDWHVLGKHCPPQWKRSVMWSRR